MGRIFCVEFQRCPLKFHTKNLAHTLEDVHFIHVKFYGKELVSVFEMVPPGDTASLQGQLNHTHATAAEQWPACSTQAQ